MSVDCVNVRQEVYAFNLFLFVTGSQLRLEYVVLARVVARVVAWQNKLS